MQGSGQFHAPAFLPLEITTGTQGPQNHSGGFGDEKNLLPLSGFEARTIQPVPRTLSRLTT